MVCRKKSARSVNLSGDARVYLMFAAGSDAKGTKKPVTRPAPGRTRIRKGKPTGDGTPLETGRATSLEGSTPSPSAADDVPVAERPRHRSSKPDRRVRLPPGTLAL